MIKIRDYRKEDYSHVRAILQEADLFDETWDSEENLSGMMVNDPKSIMVAVDGDSVVGNLFLIPYGSKVSYLFRLAVKKDYRKRGIASRLLKHAEDLAKRRGVKEIGFYVDKNSQSLQNIYKKREYKTSNKPWIYMWKELNVD